VNRSFGEQNLALHVGDEPDRVLANRRKLLETLPEVGSITWLNQVHGTTCAQITAATVGDLAVQSHQDAFCADAAWTRQPGAALAVMSADCLPVLFSDRGASLVAVAHAGWRGLCAGVLPALLHRLPVAAAELSAFIGPAISSACYEVGEEVVDALDASGIAATGVVQQGRRPGKYQLDLVQAATQQMRDLGIADIVGGHWCTASQRCFYSHRRYRQWVQTSAAVDAPEHTGRQACVVWLPPSAVVSCPE